MSELDRFKAALSDRYSVERQIGHGAVATVYLVRDLKLGRNLAFKVVQPELAASLGPDRFAREIEIAARLQHPNIVPLYESGRAGDLLYYSMPYVEGETLRDRLDREGRLPVDEALGIVGQAAEALAYAHDLGFVHRDIKPANILLHHGQAVVADFGIARAVTAAGGVRLTTAGLVIGTPAYMSPEQAVGDQEVDARSDEYSLACVLFEALAGRLPFEASSLRAVVSQHVIEPAPRIRDLRPDVPKHVDRAMVVALEKDPDDRFATVKEFAEALRDPTAARRAQRNGRGRNPRLAMYRVAGTLAIAGIGAVGIVYWPTATTLADPGDGSQAAEALPEVDSAAIEVVELPPVGDSEPSDSAMAEDEAGIPESSGETTPDTGPSEGSTEVSAAAAAVDSTRVAMENARDRIPGNVGVLSGSVRYGEAVNEEAIGRRQLAGGAPDSARTSFSRAEELYRLAAIEIDDLMAAADLARRDAEQAMEGVDSVGQTGAEFHEANLLQNSADSAYAASAYGTAMDLYEQAAAWYTAIPADPHLATRRALRGAVQQYEESVEAGDIDGLRTVFDPFDEDGWSGFFEIAEQIEVQIEVERIDPELPNPTVDLVVTTRYVDSRDRVYDRTNRFTWVFDQLDGRWVVVSQIVPGNQNIRIP